MLAGLPGAGVPRAFWERSTADSSEPLSQRANSPLNFFGLLARLVCAGVLAAWSMVAADACVRAGWAYFSMARHFAASLALYAAVGALLCVSVSALVWLEWTQIGRRVRGRARPWHALRPAFYGLIAASASASTARFTFSGDHVAHTRLKTLGPLAFMFAAGVAAALGAALVLAAVRALEQRNYRRFWLFELALALAGVSVVWIDLTQYVALYVRIHTILELAAALILGATFALELHALSLRRKAERALDSAGAALCVWLALVVLVPFVRVWIDGSLKHVWIDEAYVGRVLRRFQVAEAFFKDPFHWRGLYLSRTDRLRERFPIGQPKVAPEWQAPLHEADDFRAQINALRGSNRGYNVIVYYVDTLRNDVARDAKLMPNLARFAARSLDFTDAYAAGSDTLRSLPALTGGNYDVSTTHANDLTRVAERADYDRVLMIAKSAHEFLGKLRPDFRFDRAVDIEDYPAEMQVWGYGAQQTTAAPLVDHAIEFLGARRHAAKPFLLWLFNFDQHNWRELDGKYVEDMAQKHHVVIDDPSQVAWRYRAVAAAIDDQFGRLVKELEKRRLLESTIVIFVSDHGEALGREGFWVHSVFLWEQLIRVPLVLRAPGIAPRRVRDRVSLIDVAPTLARYMQPNPSTDGYQGEDLLGYLIPNRPARRLPLLLTAASKDVLVRVGLIDPVRNWKTVLSLEAALPELYDLASPDPDAVNLADQQPQVTLEALKTLARSPIFPRTADDFDVRDTKDQKASISRPKVED